MPVVGCNRCYLIALVGMCVSHPFCSTAVSLEFLRREQSTQVKHEVRLQVEYVMMVTYRLTGCRHEAH